FTHPEAFLAELRERGPHVDGVLRLSFRRQADESGAPIHELWVVVAGSLRRPDTSALVIVHLHYGVGGLWHGLADPESDRRRARAAQVRDAPCAAAAALGVEVRAGALRPGSGGQRDSGSGDPPFPPEERA